MVDVAANSKSFITNPFAFPSALTKNFSPFKRRFEPSSPTCDTIVLKSFFIFLSITICFIPNNNAIALETKTGSSA
uniref:Uncharacterized protein n=1 Tax=uncultured marine thaumarchaeote AD1000_96_F07 TaxID=1455948 RepID=A0A075G5V5_9ARCH|nr:hypothetical protein [uncultured marine thaumarchaeote AD1000_96_F07]